MAVSTRLAWRLKVGRGSPLRTTCTIEQFSIPSGLPLTIAMSNNGGAAVLANGLIFIAAQTSHSRTGPSRK
ncbi:hypothetical protein [Sphingomonas sp. TZW2008]|uniref:hypothetical protein n=1 Tax=Sphingomonas sp. TZW2008 TaxID=1917973 RepID=UPI0011819023|nr:hypothetical protein [Sphingomonas sp. TZW2008]